MLLQVLAVVINWVVPLNSCPESCSFLGLSTICIEGIVVSDPSGEAIDFHSGECWIP